MIERGDVYRTSFQFPNRSGTGVTSRTKYVVALQGGKSTDTWPDIAVAIASTSRGAPRRFEVLVGVYDGFNHDTVIDCRWVYTLAKSDLPPPQRQFRLSSEIMKKVSIALVVGLQMN